MTSKPAVEEKTSDDSTRRASRSSVVSRTNGRHVQHYSRASLDDEAALEEALDTVEADSIQLGQKFDGLRYTPGAIGKVDSQRADTLHRLLSMRMDRGKFEGRFMRSGQQPALPAARTPPQPPSLTLCCGAACVCCVLRCVYRGAERESAQPQLSPQHLAGASAVQGEARADERHQNGGQQPPPS